MSKRQRGRGGPRTPGEAQQQPQQQQHQGAEKAQAQSGWVPVRDAIRRDVEQATQSLAFADRVSEKLDGQRRLFIDFPRVMEELRSGALERVALALSHLYEGGAGVIDLARFLRDLPLALAHLAAAEAARRKALKPAPAAPTAAIASPPAAEGSAVAEAAPAEPSGAETGAVDAGEHASAFALAEAADSSTAAEAGPISPRLELRAKLLAAAPQLGRASQTYRRNVATVRRATAPRRAPGPWRSDREVLEQARRAVEFARQIYDAYAEAWADAPLQKNAHEAVAAETDRFLAWTQLTRYVEVSRSQPQQEPAVSQPGAEPAHESAAAPASPATPAAESGPSA